MGRKGGGTIPQGLRWKPISLQCGFWQQTWDLPSTPHHQSVGPQGQKQHSPQSTVYHVVACWAALFGRQLQLFRRRKKESWEEGAAVIFVRTGLFVGTTNIGVTPNF